MRHPKQETLLFCFVWILQRREEIGEERKDEETWGEERSCLCCSFTRRPSRSEWLTERGLRKGRPKVWICHCLGDAAWEL